MTDGAEEVGISIEARPSGTGCVECLEAERVWCMFVGARDVGMWGVATPLRLSTRLRISVGPAIQSPKASNPGRTGFYDDRTEAFDNGRSLAPPPGRLRTSQCPGRPVGSRPNWQELIR
jgi:hypothetical protein